MGMKTNAVCYVGQPTKYFTTRTNTTKYPKNNKYRNTNATIRPFDEYPEYVCESSLGQRRVFDKVHKLL